MLLHGEDWTAVRELADVAIDGVLGPSRDAFRFARLGREDHARLALETSSLALGGGRRVIHLVDASDSLVTALDRTAVDPRDVLVVVEAGALPGRSKLRAFAESSPRWLSVQAFSPGAAGIADDIRVSLARAGVKATAEALTFLVGELGSDAAHRRSELAKLELFAHGMSEVDLETVRLCCSESGEATLGDAVNEALAGRSSALQERLGDLEASGSAGPGMLAVFALQVNRLLQVRAAMDAGETAEAACRGLRPPLFPRQATKLIELTRRWSTAELMQLGAAIRAADLACKRAASADFAIAARLLLVTALRAAEGKGRGGPSGYRDMPSRETIQSS